MSKALPFLSLRGLLTCSIAVLLVFSCNKDRKTVDSITAVNPFIYGYTSGIVSKASPVRIQFAEDIATTDEIGQPASDKLLAITPKVEGALIWEDARTLRFEPSAPLPASTTFQVVLQVKKVVRQARGEDATFTFEFRTRDQFAQTESEGIFYPNERNYSTLQLKGVVHTADVAESKEVEQILKARQAGSPLKVMWEHSTDLMTHYYRIDRVSRGKKESTVVLEWDGSPLGVKNLQHETIAIPPIDQFSLMDAKVIQGEEQYIRCTFSDPLQADQLLDGLLALEGYEGNLRYLVESNRVRLYPEGNLIGKFRVSARTGIRNSNRSNLHSESLFDIEFEAVKPQVKLAGSGVIMPNSNGLHFPFEAVGLKAVDVEVFKIYHNNILQFLQDNTLDGQYDLFKVGRIVLQQKIDLQALNPNAVTGKWNGYALDLSKLIQQDDQAIYSIRIGFRPEYATLSCMKSATKSDNAFSTSPVNLEHSEEELQSIMDYWYGASGWTEDYSWERREDPCAAEYYNSERFVQRNILASNLGIIAKSGGDQQLLAVVTDLRSTDPMSKVRLEIYDFQQQRIGQGMTDQDGMARIPYKGKPFVLLAIQDKERGYLRLEDGEALMMSRYEVDGAPVQKGLKGLLYGERGVWRPGDSIFLNFILDDRTGRLPENYPIAVEVVNARGQIHEKRTSSKSVGGIYPLHFATRADAPTGNWQVKVKAGGALFEKILKIESVKPNRLEIDLDFGAQKRIGEQGGITGKLSATWLHGAPGAGLKGRVEGQLRRAPAPFNSYPSFTFNDPARQFEETEPTVLFDGNLDASGNAVVRADLLGNQEAPGMLNAVFRTRVFEPSGDFSSDNITIPFSPYAAYAGIEIPKNKYGEPRVDIGRSTPIRMALVNSNGKPLSNGALSIGIYSIEWRWWWDQFYENVSSYNTSTHYNALERYTVETNSAGIATWNFKPAQWGRYLIRVCDEAGGHCTGDYIYVGSPWNDGATDERFRDAAAMLSFKTDKARYKVGETATLTIPGGKSGKILVSLENGSRVLQTFWVASKAGENTISFKLTPEMSPNVYANVTLIQPHGQVANDLPIRLYGVAPIEVEDPATKLQPEIQMPATLKPEQAFQVEVREKTGKSMAYTLAVVDEGLLGLTRYKTPDPRDFFFAREALGVHSWDVYNQVLGAYSGTLDRVLAIGGDEGLDPAALNNTANRFEPVVRHLGPFQLGKGATARHQIKMPNYVGAVRVMVVAATKGAYGKAEKRAEVKNPLMILASAPRVLSPGDAFQLPVNVFANDKKITQVQLSVQDMNGKTVINSGAPMRVRFSKPGNQVVFIPITVKQTSGIAHFQITASGSGESTKQELRVPVRNPNPYATVTYTEVLEPGQSWNATFSPVGVAGTRTGVLEVSSILPFNIGDRLDYLIRYPYGCLEQTISTGFPQLFAAKLLNLSATEQKKGDAHIKATIEQLKGFQTAEGGFGYWPGQTTPDAWTTSYAGHFMLEAKSNGYAIPQNLLSDWLKFQKKAARMWDPAMPNYGFGREESHQLNQAYRLYTLALAGQADLSSMNRLRESKALKQAARWRLAAAYTLAGKGEVARQLVNNQDTEVQPYTELSATYGSDLRDRALMLETMLLLKDKKAAAIVAKYISEELQSSAWHSTQSTAQALVAMARYTGATPLAGEMRFTYQMPGTKSIQAGSKHAVMQIQLNGGQLRDGKALIKNTGKARIYVQVVFKGQPEPGTEVAASNDLLIQTTYKSIQGGVLNIDNLPQGKDFIAEVKVTHPGKRPIPYQELALTQIFPSGWEIINARMGDLSGSTQSSFEYQDFRDDRVNTFFDLSENQSKVFRVQLNAAYPGRYFLPAVACSAMYDQSIGAQAKGQWVTVTSTK